MCQVNGKSVKVYGDTEREKTALLKCINCVVSNRVNHLQQSIVTRKSRSLPVSATLSLSPISSGKFDTVRKSSHAGLYTHFNRREIRNKGRVRCVSSFCASKIYLSSMRIKHGSLSLHKGTGRFAPVTPKALTGR